MNWLHAFNCHSTLALFTNKQFCRLCETSKISFKSSSPTQILFIPERSATYGYLPNVMDRTFNVIRLFIIVVLGSILMFQCETNADCSRWDGDPLDCMTWGWPDCLYTADDFCKAVPYDKISEMLCLIDVDPLSQCERVLPIHWG